MAFWSKMSKSFGLNDETWMRHANPLSVYTRYTGLPLIVFSVWSRVWIGWYSLIPIIISLIWLKVNPSAFPKPKSTDNWASKCVLGERVWLNDKKIPISKNHKLAANALIAVSSVFSLIMVYGLVVLDPWLSGIGCMMAFIFKLWFADRMVWLFNDMKSHKEYKKWLY